MSAKTRRSSGNRDTSALSHSCPGLRPLSAGVIEHRGTYREGVPHNGYGGVAARSDGALMLAYPEHLGLKRGDAVTSEYLVAG